MITFEVIPIELRSNELVKDVKSLLMEVFEAKVIVQPQIPIPSEFKNMYRRQYDGLKLLQWLSSLRSIRTSVLVGVADVDAYVSGLNFIFGIADPKNRVALVFLERLKDVENSSGVSRYALRIKKEVLHEVGHVLGLKHCSYRRCVMTFSNSLYDTDLKELKYCNSCYNLLIKSGYEVNPKFMINQ